MKSIDKQYIAQFAVDPAIYATPKERWHHFPHSAYDLMPVLSSLEMTDEGLVLVHLDVGREEHGSWWFTNITALHTSLTVFYEQAPLVTGICPDGFYECQVLDLASYGQRVALALENWNLVVPTIGSTIWLHRPESPLGRDQWGDVLQEEQTAPQLAVPTFRQRIPRPGVR